MWNPPIALSAAEQTIAARTRKARKFLVFLRECRHELLDADFQHTLTESYSSGSGGHEPVEAGLLALATLLQGYCHVGDRDAVALTVMDKRWQMVLDCLGAEQPPFSQGTLCNFRMRLIAHNLDKTLLDRTVALAEKTGGCGARQLRAVLDSTPLLGASRVEDTLNLLGHALRKAVGLAAQVLDTSAEAVAADAGLTLLGHRSLQAALDLDWGEPSARERALGLVLEEVGRWQRGLEHQHALATQARLSRRSRRPSPRLSPRIRNLTLTGSRGGGVASRTSPLTGAARLKIKTYGTAAKAARKPSTASKSTLRWIWIAKSRGRWSSAQPMSRSMQSWSCWLRSWKKPLACCSSMSTWGTWPAHGLPNGRSRASTLSHVLGRKVVRCLPNRISRWTLRGCR